MASPAASGSRHHVLWLALSVAASLALSLGLACALPIAAFGAAAALTLPRRDALVLIASVWLANQMVGFILLGYPWTATTLAWGLALGVVGLLSTLGAQGTAGRLTEAAPAVRLAVTFLAAFAAYEAVLIAISVAVLGGAEIYTAAIQGRIFAINAAAFAGLLVLNRLAAVICLVKPAPRHELAY
jgi:hypothetical protein